MTGLVVDASVALAWCFPDETSEYADRVLMDLGGQTIMVPALWGIEIANAMLIGERQKRLRQPEIQRFTMLLENLQIFHDMQPAADYINSLLPIGREHGLSAYDASYLELSIRHGIPLATSDMKLRRAARKSGVIIFAEQPK